MKLMRPYYEHGGITIYHADCREVLPSVTLVALIDAVASDMDEQAAEEAEGHDEP